MTLIEELIGMRVEATGMELEFRYANPTGGNEAVLLRFTNSKQQSYNPCLLIDCGPDTDTDSLLRENDYLVGILVTHAHIDHYAGLGNNIRDGAKVYTSPDTATLLTDIFQSQTDVFNAGDVNAVRSALTPISDWTQLLGDDLRVRPIPAGHAPGAAGFLIQFTDGAGETRTILATGDFTTTQVAGYPALPQNFPVNIEALIVTGTTTAENTLTAPLLDAVERAQAGAPVLVTATSLTSIQIAYILGYLAENGQAPTSIHLAGRPATLYQKLDYDVPNVTTTPIFESPRDVLAPGTITITSPQAPTEGASGRLFDAIRDDGGAALVQITNGGDHPVTDKAVCTVNSYTYIPHPTEEAVDNVVAQLDPSEVIVTHQTERTGKRYRDKYPSYVWAGDKPEWYSLFRDGHWLAPPWMTSQGKQRVMAEATTTEILTQGTVSDLPSPRRDTSDTLDEEAIDASQFEQFSFTETIHAINTTSTDDGATATEQVVAASTTASETATETQGDTVVGAFSATETAIDAESEATQQVAADTPDADSDSPPASAESTVTARVVDAGDGLQLLRVLDEETAFEDGDIVSVTVRPSEQSEEV